MSGWTGTAYMVLYRNIANIVSTSKLAHKRFVLTFKLAHKRFGNTVRLHRAGGTGLDLSIART